MSSRNLLLNVSERKSAGLISKILKKYTEDYSRFSTKEMKSKIAEEINKDVNLEVEYVDIVDDESLESVTEVKPGKTTVCIAVYDGKVRLIDNFAIK
jgi:pantoate--beta-alanine ligase